MNKKLRVLVVEDSLTIRARLREILASDPDIEVVGEAEDGLRAVELCTALRPDVISLDLMLPVMDGLAATEHIMAHVPTPILVVSSASNRAEVFTTYDAVAAGAVDVIEKPRGDEPDGVWEGQFLAALKMVSKIKVITHPRARLGSYARTAPPKPSEPEVPEVAARALRALAIGASTGGPGAIVEVLRGLPMDLPAPVLLVLHIDDPFSAAFAEWLEQQTNRRVVFPRGGEALSAAAGKVIMARPGRHLAVEAGRLTLGLGPPKHSCRPSVDMLFASLARECGPSVAACLLTGMGRDGAAGLLEIRRAGGFTIAQDEASSVVYGMPREAALLGAADRVLPLGQIGRAMGQILLRREGGRG